MNPDVRMVHGAAAVPGAESPYDTLHWRATFPAAPAATAADDPVLGLIGPDPARVPLPVCVLHSNFNCGPEYLHWLAVSLARAGWAVVAFTWVARGVDGRPVLSPGIDLARLAEAPNAVLAPLLASVAASDLGRAGAFDFDRLAVGGHSSGGTVALLTAAPEVKACFSWGGHVLHPDGSTLAMAPGPARLVMGGTHDGVIGTLTGTQGSATEKLRATFDACPGPAHLVLFEGANHYSFAEGYDGVTGRGYREQAAPTKPAETRREVASLVCGFLGRYAAPLGASPAAESTAVRAWLTAEGASK